ncbi:Maf family protein [Oceanobacillus senegalensis]|uniref:Maf family protein n=1 Tax=Oceanobacillus senegalensis TaxID=1936063 RepID=UPI000A30A84B|nr:Maf family protein [Oceanobacillus senegalensis]
MEQQLILASSSPRRKELLENLHLTFDVIVSNVKETVDKTLPPSEIVMSLANQKASTIANKYPDAFVIGADTIVQLDGQILGKPKTKKDAFHTLKQLSDREHSVLTGVSILKGKQIVSFYEETIVEFWPLTDIEIWNYIETGEPMDKAGSYGIQELGAYLVKKINGDYFSVVGLPVARVIRELKKLGLNI